ncbi:hypothetical protein SUDANB6_05338 [Streptomyces sp. enrichment culture]
MKRRRIASVDAVRVRVAVAYLIIRSYCWAMSSQRIGRVSAGVSRGWASGSPATGRYSFTLLVRLILGSRSKFSSLVMPTPISDWPCESVWFASTSMVVPCRMAPSTIAATSEAVRLISWEWMARDFFPTCR